jgi:hypothetical protein
MCFTISPNFPLFQKELSRSREFAPLSISGGTPHRRSSVTLVAGAAPGKRTEERQTLLGNLTAMKVEQVGTGLRFNNRQLKQESRTLDQFVEYCKMWQRTLEVTKTIESEIKFVDDMHQLFDDFKTVHGRIR